MYREAVELTARLCKEYGLDPLADGVVICHAEGYQRGVASNHGDVLHWFPRFGKTMDDFRADVAQIMKGENAEMTYDQWKEYMDRYLNERAELPASGWAKPLIEEAVRLGITEGGEWPRGLATREEAIAMNLAVYKAAKK